MWNVVDFGKWSGKGKTLPQILVTDPDWFFWAIENKAFNKSRTLASQSETLARRATNIKIPMKHAPNDTVQYWFTPDGKFDHIDIIQSDQPGHQGSSIELRRSYLNLNVPREVKHYDKLGYREFISNFRFYWFDNKSLTKSRIEAFFSNAANFNKP